MTIKINKNVCNGCPGRREGCCERICPGNLIRRQDSKAVIDNPEDCWDCTACVKACPFNAIDLYLPEEIGGQGGKLSVLLTDDEIVWIFKDIERGSREYRLSRVASSSSSRTKRTK